MYSPTIARLMAAKGATYTLRKAAYAAVDNFTQGAATYSYYTCNAVERGYRPQDVRGGILDTDIKITVDASSLPAGITPVMGDQIALGTITSTNDATAPWRKVIAVYAPLDQGNLTTYKLQVRK